MQGNLVNEEATIATESEPSGKVQPSSPLAPTQPSSSSPLTTPPPTRPPVLRTLSELLPQVACDRLLLLHYALLDNLPNCTVSKRVLILRTWSLIRTFLAFWVLIGSLFIFQGPYFHYFGFIHPKNVNSVCMYTN